MEEGQSSLHRELLPLQTRSESTIIAKHTLAADSTDGKSFRIKDSVKRSKDNAYHCVFYRPHGKLQFPDCGKKKTFVSELRRHHARHGFYYCSYCFDKVETSEEAKEHPYSGTCVLRCIEDGCPNRDKVREAQNVKCRHATPSQLDIWRRLWRLVCEGEPVLEPSVLSPRALEPLRSLSRDRMSWISIRSTASPQPMAEDMNISCERGLEAGANPIDQRTFHSRSRTPDENGRQPAYSSSDIRMYHCVYHDPEHPERDLTEFCCRMHKTMSALKRHHAQQRHNFYYCTNCFQVLESARERDEHERASMCDFKCVEENCPNYAMQIIDFASPCKHGRQNSQSAIWNALRLIGNGGELIPRTISLDFMAESSTGSKTVLEPIDMDMLSDRAEFPSQADASKQVNRLPTISQRIPWSPAHPRDSFSSFLNADVFPVSAPFTQNRSYAAMPLDEGLNSFSLALPPETEHEMDLFDQLDQAFSSIDSQMQDAEQRQARPTQRESQLESLLVRTWNAIVKGDEEQVKLDSKLHREVSEMIPDVNLERQNRLDNQQLILPDMQICGGAEYKTSAYSDSIYSGSGLTASDARTDHGPDHDAVSMLTATSSQRIERSDHLLLDSVAETSGYLEDQARHGPFSWRSRPF